MITWKVELILLISCQQFVQPVSNQKNGLWTHLCLYWAHAEPMLKQFVGDNNIQVTNFEFRYELSKALVLPSIQRRFKNQNGLQIKILNKMRHVLNIQEVNHRRQNKNHRRKSGCCFKCVDEIVGTADYKNKREKLNNKLKSKCHLCSQFLCKVHQKSTKYVCEDCFVEDE